VADPEGRVLLFSAGRTGEQRWWFTPGGGMHRGETVWSAGVRELFEETGFKVTEDGLGPVVATSTGHWYAGESDTHYLGAHTFFFVRVADPTLNTDGQEDLERSVITGHHWWSVAELRAKPEPMGPPAPALAELLERLLRGDVPNPPVRLPRRE
jgi:8-oxo-dGTP pyrophosphatase MutT (NUDIX family)